MLRTIRRGAAIVAVTAFLTLLMTSVASAQTDIPAPPNPDGIHSASTEFGVERASGDAVQAGYEQCPYGRACVFQGWNGYGTWLYMTQCGWVNLAPYGNSVSSVKTHGNAIWLWDSEANDYSGYVPAWTQTNLASWEDNRADFVYVVC